VTEKHTINAIKKAKAGTAVTNAAGKAARSDFLKQVGDAMYSNILENKYDRGDETAADQVGVKLANAAGWAPSGLSAFLTRLAERNAGLKDRSGLFASHPETTSRIDAMKKTIAGQNLAAAALVQARYTQHITFKPVAVTAVAQVAPPAATPAAPAASSTSGNMSTPPTAGVDSASAISARSARQVEHADGVVGRFTRCQPRSRCQGRRDQDTRDRDGHGSGSDGVQEGHRVGCIPPRTCSSRSAPSSRFWR
jgi:hypothetical protein